MEYKKSKSVVHFWQMKFTNDKGPFVILRTFIILIKVGSCAAYGCTNEKQKGWDIPFFNLPHHNPELLQKWYKQCEEKIGFQASIDWYVVHTSQNLVLLLGKVKEVCHLKRMQFQQFPAFLGHLQKMYQNRYLPRKGCQKNLSSKYHHPKYRNYVKLTIHTTQQNVLPHKKLITAWL